MYNYGQLQVTFDDGSVGWYEAGWGPMMSEIAFFVKDVIGPKGCVSIVKDPNEAAAASSDDIDSHTKTNCIRLHHSAIDANNEFVKAGRVHQHRGRAGSPGAVRSRAGLPAARDPAGRWTCRRTCSDAVNSLRIVLAADESFRTGQSRHAVRHEADLSCTIVLPTHIGRYRVTRLIRPGRHGRRVRRARRPAGCRPVAIKVVRPEAVSDERARERFRREARAAARVSHPHICPLYEFDEADGHPFLVMELLEGEPLSVRLARGAMPLDEALALAQTMLDALAALHRRGIMHRDLKPANVFLTPHG